jgi:hypothetical protein
MAMLGNAEQMLQKGIGNKYGVQAINWALFVDWQTYLASATFS